MLAFLLTCMVFAFISFLQVSEGKCFSFSTDNPLYTDTRYNDNIHYNDNLTVTKPSLKR